MTVHVLLNVYREARNLPRCVSSIRETMPDKELSFVFVDGKYPDYPEGPDFSDDGTKEIAEAEGTYLPVSDYECEKRTAGLAHIDTVAKDGDWVLVQDADEILTEVFGWPTIVGKFDFTRTSDGIEYGRCRLFRWEPGLRFQNRHYELYRAGGELLSSLETAPNYDLVGAGVHYDQSHDPERVRVKKDYYRILRDREGHPATVIA